VEEKVKQGVEREYRRVLEEMAVAAMQVVRWGWERVRFMGMDEWLTEGWEGMVEAEEIGGWL
jgi:hypothetical protein